MHIRRKYSVQQEDRISAPLFVSMLAVAFSNLLGLGSYMLLALCAVFFVWNYYRIKIPVSAFPITIFACLYFFFQINDDGISSIFKIFLCPLLWIVGYNLEKNPRMRVILKIAAIFAMGMAIHGVANYYYNTVNAFNMAMAMKMDVWTGEGMAATGQAVLFTPFLSVLIWLVFAGKKRWIKVGAVILFLCSLMYSIQLGSRTFLLLMVLSVVLGVAFYAQKQDKGMKILFAALVLAGTFAILYSTDTFGLRTYIEGSYLIRRMNEEQGFFNLSENGRFYFKRKYLENILLYPWGGSHLREEIVGAYAHDLWLDIMDEAGIPAALAILVYTITAFYRILILSRNRKVPKDEKIALRSYAIIMCAQFFVEPIWQGSPMLLLFFVLIDGMLTRYVRMKNYSVYTPGVGSNVV